MRLYAIGDLHLPGGDEKPMDVFGPHWQNHFSRISEDWRSRVKPEDAVLLPGDLSWAMQLQDALPDLQAIAALPGRKVLIKGNHDLWWGGIGQLRRALPEGVMALQHDAVDLGAWVVCGSRGWAFPTDEAPLVQEDERIFQRELIRLEMSMEAAAKMAMGRPVIVMMHYPPLYRNAKDTPFTRLIARYPVHTVAYGHLHGASIHGGFNGEHEGVRYRLVSCDSRDFSLTDLTDGEI